MIDARLLLLLSFPLSALIGWISPLVSLPVLFQRVVGASPRYLVSGLLQGNDYATVKLEGSPIYLFYKN